MRHNYKKLPKANATLTKTRTRLADLIKCWEKVQQLHDKITIAATAKDWKELSYFLQDEFLVAEDAYNEAAEAISSFVIPESPAYGPIDSTFCDGTKSSSLILPRIPLPTFSGKFSEWETYRHTFQSLIDSNKTMTNVAKFYYLKSSVIEDAASFLNQFQVFPDGYDNAWKMMLKEYDNKRALIHTYLQSFVCLPKGKVVTELSELKKLRDTVSVALAMLTKLEFQVSSWDPILVFIIKEKLSSKTRAKWNQKQINRREYPSY
jgi:hypothetical protein